MVDIPLPLTPDEEHAIANGYATGDSIREARLSNGHGVHGPSEGARQSRLLPAGAVSIFPPSNSHADSNVNGHVRDSRLVSNGHAISGGAHHHHHDNGHHSSSRPTSSLSSHHAEGKVLPPPPRKAPKKRAQENTYDDPQAVRGKNSAPSNRHR